MFPSVEVVDFVHLCCGCGCDNILLHQQRCAKHVKRVVKSMGWYGRYLCNTSAGDCHLAVFLRVGPRVIYTLSTIDPSPWPVVHHQRCVLSFRMASLSYNMYCELAVRIVAVTVLTGHQRGSAKRPATEAIDHSRPYQRVFRLHT